MGHSFKLKNNINKKDNMDYSLVAMIAFIFIAIICCAVSFLLMNNKSNLYVSKTDNNKDYIYTIKKEENKNQEDEYNEVPTINLNGYESVNNQILENYKKIITKPEYNYKYEYSQSKNILSLAISYSYYLLNSQNELDVFPITYFDTYNIDLKTGKIITDEELLKKYSVSKSKLKTYMQAKFTNYYNELIKQKYFTKAECNYNCFLANRGITEDYLKNTSFYVEKGSLILLKFYYKGSYINDYREEEFFNEDDYKFLIKD